MVQPAPGEDGEHPTFCRICEACCGLVATVKDGRIVKVIPDRDNPHSQGHACVKGTFFHELVHDPDRVMQPLKRVGGPGVFEPVSWDEALDDVAARLKAIRDRDGPQAIASYQGNPTSFATDSVMTHSGMMRALGARKMYGPGSQDNNARSVANFIVFGAVARSAFPDLPNCDFLMILGANPLVSNGSLMFAPRLRHDFDAIAERGRLVVVDPRRSETAQRYEHLPIRPNGDVWLLLGMARVLFDESLVDRARLAEIAVGAEALEAQVAKISVAEAAARCGVDEAVLRQLALDFASTPRAAIYGRVGVCRGPYATLVNFLITALNVLGGKFGVRGGEIFGHILLAGSERASPGGYAESESRVGAIPTVSKYQPSAVLPADILDPGDGQVRALLLTAGNPLLSAPGGARLEEALASLELLVAFDMYVNESNRHAHYVLPAPTFFERDDVPYIGMNMLMRPFIQYTQAVIPPVGEAWPEDRAYREIIARMGLTWPTRSAEEREALERGIVHTPLMRYDDMLRRGPAGDGYGERDGWSFEKLKAHPHGVMIELADPTEGWRERLAYPDRKLRLWHPLVEAEFARLGADQSGAPGLALIGRRDIRSINSWMHNISRLVRSQRPELLVHPDDAAARGIATGDDVRLWNAHGELLVEALVSTEVAPGVVCYPHGWGHKGGGWRLANAQPAPNINVLLGLGVDAVEFVSGTTLMDGIEVFIDKAPPEPAEALRA